VEASSHGSSAAAARGTTRDRSAAGKKHGFTPVKRGSSGDAARKFAATRGKGKHTGLTKSHTPTRAHGAPTTRKAPAKHVTRRRTHKAPAKAPAHRVTPTTPTPTQTTATPAPQGNGNRGIQPTTTVPAPPSPATGELGASGRSGLTSG
jgi:hypothetical protein